MAIDAGVQIRFRIRRLQPSLHVFKGLNTVYRIGKRSIHGIIHEIPISMGHKIFPVLLDLGWMAGQTVGRGDNGMDFEAIVVIMILMLFRIHHMAFRAADDMVS